MRQVIPFYKEIVFKTNIASVTSISLEHEEVVKDGEVSGYFTVLGNYKIHNDTTEVMDFKYKLPFTALIPDELNVDTVTVDIDNFTFEQIESDVLRVNIDFSIEGELQVVEERDEVLDDLDKEIEEILGNSYLVVDNDSLDNSQEKVDTLGDVEDMDVNLEIPVFEEERDEAVDEVVLDLDEEREDNMVETTNVEEVVYKDSVVNNGEILVTKNTEVDEKIEESEEYVTYHVHLVKNDETLEHILTTYNVSLDYLKEYNEISEIKVGDKIIIPEYGE